MDHVVHINNGSADARPVVLRLLPGEETIFNLKVVNHGEPSNVSLQASNQVFKAVRLKKPDHYVVLEETIPVMARMPANKKRLDGEILLKGNAGESRVPITLLRDSDDPDPGDDEDDKENVGQKSNRANRYDEADLVVGRDDSGDDADEDLQPANEDDDYVDDGDEDGEDEDVGDGEEGDDYDDDSSQAKRRRSRRSGDDDDDSEPRRIVFSKDRDLQRYRSATRSRRGAVKDGAAGIDQNSIQNSNQSGTQRINQNRTLDRTRNSNQNKSQAGYPVRTSAGGFTGENDQGDLDHDDDNDDDEGRSPVPRYSTRIDDRFVDRNNRQRPEEIRSSTVQAEEERQGYRQEVDGESREIIHQAERELDERVQAEREQAEQEQSEREQAAPEERRFYGVGEENEPGYAQGYDRGYDQDQDDEEQLPSSFSERLGGFGGLGGLSSLKVIPAAIFLALVIVLVLTFITESIPEFAGALGSSILIVTLIIYGAATLLKA
ncbi:MAG TPA: hypothetical protein PLZ44_00435 [Methanothrix sp.]|nr:hypothetical protein [Methanothrix sp.]